MQSIYYEPQIITRMNSSDNCAVGYGCVELSDTQGSNTTEIHLNDRSHGCYKITLKTPRKSLNAQIVVPLRIQSL